MAQKLKYWKISLLAQKFKYHKISVLAQKFKYWYISVLAQKFKIFCQRSIFQQKYAFWHTVIICCILLKINFMKNSPENKTFSKVKPDSWPLELMYFMMWLKLYQSGLKNRFSAPQSIVFITKKCFLSERKYNSKITQPTLEWCAF